LNILQKEKGKKGKIKSTSAKVSNKKLNKFAKQGKLRKQRLKHKSKEQKRSRKDGARTKVKEIKSEDFSVNSDGEQVEEELQAEDVDFYGGQDTAFVRFAAKSLTGFEHLSLLEYDRSNFNFFS
jgi:hypothetical protein